MPVYSYTCTCGWSADIARSVDGRDGVICPGCGCRTQRRMSKPLIVIPEVFGQSIAEIERITQPSDLATGSYTTERHRFAR